MKLKTYLKKINPITLFKSASLKSVMVLMSGTLISQVLPIVFFPILSRIYSPADYGVLGLFMSGSMLLTVISNLQLNYAILVPKEEEEALSVFYCGCYIVVFFSFLSLLGVVFFGVLISNLLGSPELSIWLYILPLTVFFSGINIQLSSWFNRSGKFKVISISRITSSVVVTFFSLTLSFLLFGPSGLIIAYLMGAVSSFILLSMSFFRENTYTTLSPLALKSIVKKYRNFPLYSMPTELISNFAQQLPIYIFSIYSGVQSVGYFTRSRQMLALPVNYLSGSISEVYKQKSSEAFRNAPYTLRSLFLKTMMYLVLTAVVPFVIAGIFSPPLFAFLFGENWRQAGVFSQCLVFVYFFKFIISPLTFNFYLFNKQRLDFLLHILIIILTSIALYAGFYFFKSDVMALTLFSASYSFVYLIYGVLSYYYTSREFIAKNEILV